MLTLIAALTTLMLVTPAAAQVQIDIGIRLPAPPQLVIVPEVRAVQYVPTVPSNLFFYDGQYWAFVNGTWHVSRVHTGPWVVVAPVFVPRPILLVPVSYYRVPPGHWKQWQRGGPPHWAHEWGREWADKRQWQDRDRDHDKRGKGARSDKDDERGKGKGRGEGRGKGEGPGRGKGH
ncbi:MAG TPA: hypothetical protein VJU81_11940 [Methylomirabilota bacterium]|nr:hypothetical protein [Methylomirabilota bacterium]